MSDATPFIPVVDLSAVVGSESEESVVQRVAQQLHDAFSTVGFVYVTNHGIPDSQLSATVDAVDKFFALDTNVKKGYLRQKDNFGYVAMEMERLDDLKPGDLKEAFNCTFSSKEKKYPTEVPGFQEAMESLSKSCQKLSHVIMRLMAIGLKLEDKEFFTKRHCYDESNPTTLRCLYYPALPNTQTAKEGQLRCGEHSDYGSITFLFQDGVAGLEVQNVQGEYQEATPMPGAIVVNIGDLMQRWTSDQLKSTKHRVRMIGQPGDGGASTARRSIAYFIQPDDDCVIQCIDGSNKYPSVTSKEYLNSRFNATY